MKERRASDETAAEGETPSVASRRALSVSQFQSLVSTARDLTRSKSARRLTAPAAPPAAGPPPPPPALAPALLLIPVDQSSASGAMDILRSESSSIRDSERAGELGC